MVLFCFPTQPSRTGMILGFRFLSLCWLLLLYMVDLDGLLFNDGNGWYISLSVLWNAIAHETWISAEWWSLFAHDSTVCEMTVFNFASWPNRFWYRRTAAGGNVNDLFFLISFFIFRWQWWEHGGQSHGCDSATDQRRTGRLAEAPKRVVRRCGKRLHDQRGHLGLGLRTRDALSAI